MEALPLDCITLLLHTGAKHHFLSINSILIKHSISKYSGSYLNFRGKFFFGKNWAFAPVCIIPTFSLFSTVLLLLALTNEQTIAL